jgi:hypothetical protein
LGEPGRGGMKGMNEAEVRKMVRYHGRENSTGNEEEAKMLILGEIAAQLAALREDLRLYLSREVKP